MGNFLYTIFFGQPKTINEAAFDYRIRNTGHEHKGVFEIETDDFTDKEDIRKRLLALPDPDNVILNRVDIDIIPALTYYLQNDSNTSKLYTNKVILSQTDYFVFKEKYDDVVALLVIKNTQAESNRIKLSTYYIGNTSNDRIYTATCILSKL